MRLIDADALTQEHCKDCSNDIQEDCKHDPICASMMWITEAPTVEDAVVVVRCKDCKYMHTFKDKNGNVYGHGCSIAYGMPNTEPMDFCNHGERKSSDEIS